MAINSVPDATFAAIPHFVRRTALWNSFVAEISRVRVLWFGQFSQETLLFFRGLFYSFVELVPGSVFYILPPGREDSSLMFLLARRCLKHRSRLPALAG